MIRSRGRSSPPVEADGAARLQRGDRQRPKPPAAWPRARSQLPYLAFATLACSAAGAYLSGPLGQASALEAFPGAEGYGRFAQGGRGGRIIEVTTLADSGVGSLRACIESEGPRICVFRVGGVIRFTSKRPMIRNPFLTIAGETAPGGGILLTHAGGAEGFTPLVVKDTHDVVIRHIRVRTDLRGDHPGSNDAFGIDNSHDVILDHVSGSWALDENLSAQADNDNITVSWSIFAEGIRRHDKCALLASDPTRPQRFSFIRNLCAHNGDRNPDVNFPPGSCVDVVNNVMYNAKAQFTEVWESYGGSSVNIVGNYYRWGPDTDVLAPAIDHVLIGSTGRAWIYQSGNQLDGGERLLPEHFAGKLAASPVCSLAVQYDSASETYAEVLAGAGAFPRDDVDRRLIREVESRTGSIRKGPGTMPQIAGGIPYEDLDGDGISDNWERENGLDPADAADMWLDHDNDGWANLEEFLDHAHRELLNGRIVQ